MSERHIPQHSLVELHEEMSRQLQNFAISTRSAITQQSVLLGFSKHRETQVGYWLNRYHDTWDKLEACGLKVETVNLPEVNAAHHKIPDSWPDFKSWPHTTIKWNNEGFEEPTRTRGII